MNPEGEFGPVEEDVELSEKDVELSEKDVELSEKDVEPIEEDVEPPLGVVSHLEEGKHLQVDVQMGECEISGDGAKGSRHAHQLPALKKALGGTGMLRPGLCQTEPAAILRNRFRGNPRAPHPICEPSS